IAKNLLDGDTLWAVSTGISRHDHDLKDSLRNVLQLRIEQIRALLVDGDPLLSLETMRASNLAVVRTCKRLVASSPRQELDWEAMSHYYRMVRDLSAHWMHGGGGAAGDALTHELSRAIALGMHACPSSLIRLTSWIMETSPTESFLQAIRSQLSIV